MAGTGGARPGAGRKKGSKLTRTREVADRIMAEGLTPLEFLLSVMRAPVPITESASVIAAHRAIQFEAAKAAAPFVHPRLASVTSTQNVRMGVTLVDEFPA